MKVTIYGFGKADKIKEKFESILDVIFDGRNFYNPDYLKRRGFIYYAIGRSVIHYTVYNV